MTAGGEVAAERLALVAVEIAPAVAAAARIALVAVIVAAAAATARAQETPDDGEPSGAVVAPSPFGKIPEARRQHTLDDLRQADTGERAVDEPESSAPGVEILDARDATTEGTDSAADLLESAPAVWASTGSRGERIFDMRGFEQRQVRVTLDGVPLLVPYDGQLDLAKIPAGALDHVTLASGAGSTIYGPNGLAGTVNLVTHRPGEGPLVNVSAEAGTGADRRVSARHSYRLGPVAWVLDAGYEKRARLPLPGRPLGEALPMVASSSPEKGWIVNSDRELLSLIARGSADVGAEQRIELGARYIDGAFGVPPERDDEVAEHWRFNDWRMLALSAGHSGRLGRVETDELLYASWYDNRLDAYDDVTYGTQASPAAFRSWFHDRSVGGRLRASAPLPLLPLSPDRPRADLWLELRNDQHRDEQQPSPGAAQSIGEPGKRVSATLLTAAPEVAVPIGRRSRAGLGLQADAEIPGGEQDPLWALGPLASFRFRPNARIDASVSGSRRTRFPTLKERFASKVGDRIGNPELTPESAWSFGAQARAHPFAWLALRLSVFESEVEGLIEDVPLGDGTSQLANVGHARLAGGELHAGVHWRRVFELSLFYGYLYGRLTSGGSSERGGRLQDRPAHRGGLKAMLRPVDEVTLSATAQAAGPTSFVDRHTGTWGILGSHLSLDARLAYEVPGWGTAWLRAENFLDTRYETRYGFPEPGRRIFIGLEVGR